jgi:hypothetical protein
MNSHGLRRASEWRPRKTRLLEPPGRDAGGGTCSRAASATSRSGRCTRGTRWCWVRRRSRLPDARDPRRKCNESSSKSPVSAGHEGIEPSLRGLEARPVTMTLQPKKRLVRGSNPSQPIDNRTATPVASRGIKQSSARGVVRGLHPPPLGHSQSPSLDG